MRAETDLLPDSIVYDPFGISSESERESLLGEIAREEIIYTSLEQEYRAVEEDVFHQIVSSSPNILILGSSSDSVFQNTYNAVSASQTGIKDQVYRYIESRNYSAALSLNASLVSTESWIQSRRLVNERYLDSWCQSVYSFNPADYDTLLSLAMQSPHLYGDAVFSARVLLGLDPDDVPLTESGIVQKTVSEPSKMVFYPNPTTDKICFIAPESTSPFTTAIIDFHNAYGQWVEHTIISATTGVNCIPIKGNLKPGFYVVRISLNGKNYGTGKIVIR